MSGAIGPYWLSNSAVLTSDPSSSESHVSFPSHDTVPSHSDKTIKIPDARPTLMPFTQVIFVVLVATVIEHVWNVIAFMVRVGTK